MIRALLDRAFADDPPTVEDWEHCQGGVHVLRHVDDVLVGFAAVVERTLWIGERPVRCGYVEGMAVDPAQQRRGHGRAIMADVAAVMAGGGFDLGALAASEAGVPLYEAAGWRRWRARCSRGPAPAGASARRRRRAGSSC